MRFGDTVLLCFLTFKVISVTARLPNIELLIGIEENHMDKTGLSKGSNYKFNQLFGYKGPN
jgi:hypothetical protein